MISSPVIAVTPVPDQEQESGTFTDGADWLSWWPVPAAIAALLILLWIPDIRLRRPRLRLWSFSPLAGLIFFMTALLGGLFASRIALSLAGGGLAIEQADQAIPPDLRSIVFMMLGNYIGQGVVLLLVPGLILGKARSADPMRSGLSWWKAMAAGTGAMVLFWPLVLASGLLAGIVITLLTGQELPEIAHTTLLQLQQAAENPDIWLILALIMIVLLTPILEELMYRGLLQESIRRMPGLVTETPWIAIALTSIIFAVMHAAVVDQRGLVALIVLSMGFGWIALRTGRLLSCIVMHGLFNLLNLVQVLA